jgi:RimJ/RimL family protein N-acetyltransferase
MAEETVGKIVFETPRLTVHLAVPEDAQFVHSLWTDPRVMRNVGFPNGLRITVEEVKQSILLRGDSEFEQLLIIRIKQTEIPVGQCIMQQPAENGISETDVKLDPTYWGQRFGVEIKQGLVDYLFTHTDCKVIQATPNVGNVASVKMQEAVGGVRVGESVYEFPESMREFTTPIHHYIYQVTRENWQRSKAGRW